MNVAGSKSPVAGGEINESEFSRHEMEENEIYDVAPAA